MDLSLGHASTSTMGGINLAICAVNLAEAGAQTMGTETLAEIYATAAMTVKLSFPSFMQFLAVSTFSSLNSIHIILGIRCSMYFLFIILINNMK